MWSDGDAPAVIGVVRVERSLIRDSVPVNACLSARRHEQLSGSLVRRQVCAFLIIPPLSGIDPERLRRRTDLSFSFGRAAPRGVTGWQSSLHRPVDKIDRPSVRQSSSFRSVVSVNTLLGEV